MISQPEWPKNPKAFRYGLLVFIFFYFSINSNAQQATIFGNITDSLNKPVDAVTVALNGEANGTVADAKGYYELSVPAGKEITIVYSSLGYHALEIKLFLESGERKKINQQLQSKSILVGDVKVEGGRSRELMITKINPRSIEAMPSVSGNFESILKTLPGVVSNNEMSSNYSVRGGSYDENLVYVNDIEIYRPFLVRSGQQEGLSFINSDLVADISFSAGGFGAVYGDKLSSVLDIKYKRPEHFAGSTYFSLLGAGFHLEGTTKNKKGGFLFGVRRKSNQFLLNTLDTKGEYKPSFTDVQALFNYKLGRKTELSFLGNYSSNKYQVIPTDRETEFGNINEALKFTVFFEGQEIDKYDVTQGALSFSYQPSEKLKLRLISGAFYTNEQEYFDIIGAYRLDELERDLGSSQFGNVAFNRGVGAFLAHARNDLDAFVYYAEHKGSYLLSNSSLSWGLKAQHESINDNLDEWVYRDSSDFSVPHPADQVGDTLNYDQQIVVNDLVHTKNIVNTNRYNGYLQFNKDYQQVSFNLGLRATYWNWNKELDISPRASILWKPLNIEHLTFRFATGFYYQPPFYREMRNLQGEVNKEIQSQQSIHFVLGGDYQFLAWGREFKYTVEAYYKKLTDLIPYKSDNLRLRYYGTNNSNGYAYGLDMRVNGEFVNGIESWASLSFLKTEENLTNDYYVNQYDSTGKLIIPGYSFNTKAAKTDTIYPGNIPRPSDQRVTFSIFFQDYLPKFPTFRMHLTLIFGSGLPFGPPGYDRYKDVLRMPTYRRVDIGFSKIIIDEDKVNESRLPVIRKLNSLWFSLEVFNLLQINNTVSYTWITDVTGRRYAVPNYLSSRLINARLTARF